MGEWPTRALSALVSLQRGYDLPTETRTAGTVPVVGSGGISGWHNEAREEGLGVVVGRAGASIGKPTLVKGPYWPLNTTLFVKDFKGNNPRWVYYLFEITDLTGFNSGGAQPMLNRNYIAGLRVRTPGISEQRAIADVLSALDDKVVANDLVVSLSDKLAEAVLAAALDGRSSPLASHALVTMGSSPPGTSYNDNVDGLPFYQGVRDFGIRFPRRRVWTNAPVRMARTDDTLVSVRAPVGRTNIANEDMCIGRGVASLRSRAGCPMTLFHQVRAAREEWAPYEAEGTVFGAINKRQLEAVLLPTVRPEAGENLERTLTAIESRIAAALSENEALMATRDELLPLLMSGRVRVQDAEKVVEGVV